MQLPEKISDRDRLTLVLDWELPEVISREKTWHNNARKSINVAENVVFLASSTHEGYIIEANSLSEYLSTFIGEGNDEKFIKTMIDLLNQVDFEGPESGKQFQDKMKALIWSFPV